MNKHAQPGVGVIFSVDGAFVAGQENATLNRKSSPINITNQINGEWSESIGGIKSWDLMCNGTYIKNAESLLKLEDAFMNNKEIVVRVFIGKNIYEGKALITNFPLNVAFSNSLKYSISLLGTGALQQVYE